MKQCVGIQKVSKSFECTRNLLFGIVIYAPIQICIKMLRLWSEWKWFASNYTFSRIVTLQNINNVIKTARRTGNFRLINIKTIALMTSISWILPNAVQIGKSCRYKFIIESRESRLEVHNWCEKAKIIYLAKNVTINKMFVVYVKDVKQKPNLDIVNMIRRYFKDTHLSACVITMIICLANVK